MGIINHLFLLHFFLILAFQCEKYSTIPKQFIRIFTAILTNCFKIKVSEVVQDTNVSRTIQKIYRGNSNVTTKKVRRFERVAI